MSVPAKLLCLMVLAGLAPSARGDTNTFSVTPSPIAIVDDAYDGSLGSMTSISLPVPVSGTIQDLNVSLGLSHTWVGDLVVKLRSPSDSIITLASRPGLLENSDDGNGAGGNSADLSATFPISFDDSATNSAETMGLSLGDSGVICRDDGLCTYAPNSGSAAPGNLSSLTGQDSLGTWRIYVGDAAGGDTGTIHQFSLTMVTLNAVGLRIAQSGNNVVLSWPTNPPGLLLQANPSLQTNGWAAAGGSQVVSGGRVSTSFPATNASRFFRLRQP